MIQFSARIGTSPAAKRVDAAALAFQRRRAEAARHRAEAEEARQNEAAEEARAAARQANGSKSARQWAEDQVAAWAERQPHIVVSTFKPRWRVITEEVATRHGVTFEDLVGPSRAVLFVEARFEAMYRIADETPLSLPEIGRRFGGRDHSTAFHAIRGHAARHGLPLPRQDEEDPS